MGSGDWEEWYLENASTADLLAVIGSDSPPRQRAAAAWAVGERGDWSVLAPLRELRDGADDRLRTEIDAALDKLNRRRRAADWHEMPLIGRLLTRMRKWRKDRQVRFLLDRREDATVPGEWCPRCGHSIGINDCVTHPEGRWNSCPQCQCLFRSEFRNGQFTTEQYDGPVKYQKQCPECGAYLAFKGVFDASNGVTHWSCICCGLSRVT